MKESYRAACPEILRDFLLYSETIQGKSAKTVNEYFLDLRNFFRFVKVSRGLVGSDTPFDEIDIMDVDLPLIRTVTLMDSYEFLNYAMRERGNNASSRSRKVSSIRGFFKYLTSKRGLLEQNPMIDLEPPKKKSSLPKYLTLEESLGLLNAVPAESKFRERDYCILTLFLNCGMRLSELVALNLSDIREDTVTVTGKGNKERSIYLNEACIAALKDYIAVRPNDRAKDKKALFISRNGNRISAKTVQWTVKKYLSAIGLEDYSTHKLRHTAATLMYQHGDVDIRILKDILGHKNLGTTEIYTHVSDKQKKRAADASPLSKVKKRRGG
ncbi:MAG: tyrosine recombinase XerC [Oscillospiraceae bacterium]|nr:tyrosine recombinase XerC [Oscillospiraceae bacterium]MBQ8732724.1 tyrosine recombinase XerC [Oscillospiraceae bacterium]